MVRKSTRSSTPSLQPDRPQPHPDASDPWTVRPIAFAYYAREALRQRLADLRRVPVPFPQGRLLIGEDGKALIRADTTERGRELCAALDRWLAASNRYGEVGRLVFGTGGPDRFREVRGPQLRDSLIANGTEPVEADRIGRDAVDDLLAYLWAGAFEEIPGGIIDLRPTARWAEDSATLARTASPLTVAHCLAEERRFPGTPFANPFFRKDEEEPDYDGRQPPAGLTPEAIEYAHRHARHLLDLTFGVAARFAQDNAHPDVFDLTPNRIDALGTACPSSWAGEELRQRLVTIRDAPVELLGGRIVRHSAHEAVVELAQCVLYSTQDAAFATIRSADVEQLRLMAGPYHPCELPKMAGWFRSHRAELLAALDRAGYQRLKCEIEREAVELADTCPLGHGGSGADRRQPVRYPYYPLRGYSDIFAAMNEFGDKAVWKTGDNNKLKELNTEFGGPIRFAGQGGQPEVERGELLVWYEGISRQQEASRREDDSPLEEKVIGGTYLYGVCGEVAPEIGGHIVHRRK